MDHDFHRLAMAMALRLAKKGCYTVSPNPIVGCVLFQGNTLVGKGFHRYAGGPHAEIEALKEAGDLARGATLYVNLEPCCHHGRTPPCTDALIRAGIQKAYVACEDPNPLVAGKGIQVLRQAGVAVEVGLCEQAAQDLNRFFIHFMTKGRPFVIAKWAMSLDGRMKTHPGDSRVLSGPASLKSAHRTRALVDAMVIGKKTALQDDPLLTVRHFNSTRHPLRCVLTSRGELPLHLKMLDPALPGQTIVVTTSQSPPVWREALRQKQIEVWMCKTANGKVDLHDFLERLAERRILSLLVEGGGSLHDSFFKIDCVDAVEVYLTPHIVGPFQKKRSLPSMTMKQRGEDFLLIGEIK